MEYFKYGQSRSGYSMAFAKYRQNLINENFAKVAWGIIIVIVFIYLVLKYRLWTRLKQAVGRRALKAWSETAATTMYLGIPIRRQNTFKAFVLRVLDSLRYSIYVIFHPFDGFWDLKHEKRGNVTSATIILLLTILAWVFRQQYEGFIFNERR